MFVINFHLLGLIYRKIYKMEACNKGVSLLHEVPVQVSFDMKVSNHFVQIRQRLKSDRKYVKINESDTRNE
jgi:hypothetical protein